MTERPTMRALTVIRPMAWAIVAGHKPWENRSQDLPKWMRGRRTVVAIHAGRKFSRAYEDAVHAILGVCLPYTALDEGIVGLACFTGRVVRESPSPWFSGPYGYEIDGAVRFHDPIPCRGMLGFWGLSPSLEARVLARCPPCFDPHAGLAPLRGEG